MTATDLLNLLNEIQNMKCETQNLELKAARQGCPKHLYDTLSSFSNQDNGGIIVFGVDEEHDYDPCGVYDAQDLQKQLHAQCLQMEPQVRPVITVAQQDGRNFVAAEIPGIDMADRPCYYRGRGRLKGSFIRVGDSDASMTEYEIYSYEAFRKKYQDEVRTVPRENIKDLSEVSLNEYLSKIKQGKPNIAALPEDRMIELLSILRDGKVTLAANMLFGLYPQVFFPQLCITAVVVPGTVMGSEADDGARFLDNQRIEGTIPQMLQGAMQFIWKNMKKKTVINKENGRHEEIADYPVTALREAVINALVHRDYSIHTEGMPICIRIYEDRLEIASPGGIYGRLSVDELGHAQPDTRNPVLASALEVLGITENRYSGIPTMQRAMHEAGLPPVELNDQRGTFVVVFRKAEKNARTELDTTIKNENTLLEFCHTARTKQQIADFLGVKTLPYVMSRYIRPLLESGQLRETDPDRPRSRRQKYIAD